MEYQILKKIKDKKEIYPKKLKKLSNYILLNADKISIMTVAELAKNADVSTTTVMRLIKDLNFDTFIEFKKYIMMDNTKNYSSYGNLKKSLSIENPESINMIIEDGILSIKKLYSDEIYYAINKAVDLIISSTSIFTLGFRSSKALSLYLEYSLIPFISNIFQLANDPDYAMDKISTILSNSDVLILLSIWPITKKSLNVAELCREIGIPIILITNTELNPICSYSDIILNANSINNISGNLSIIAIIEILVSEIGKKLSPKSTENISRIERLLDKNDIITRN